MKRQDVIIVGAGIVGLSTAMHILQKSPEKSVLILEKEGEIAIHQTGHNSGVMHSGIYYTPGSLRAKNCQTGYRQLIEFCESNDVKYDICGKVIVAVDDEEIQRLEGVFERGQANGLDGIKMISGEEVAEIEPHIQAKKGIWVPQTGIVHFPDVASKILERFRKMGGEIILGAKVINVLAKADEVIVETSKGAFHAEQMINCAGLYADKVAEMTGDKKGLSIIPFRGEYYRLLPEKEYLVKNLVYPTPNPAFPFLGVHFTRMIKGGIEAGPNAVFAFAREGYSNKDINWSELWSALKYPGFRKLGKKHWRFGLDEMKRSYSKKHFYHALRRMMPELKMEDVEYYRAGVRAMALGRDGEVVDDFVITETHRVLNVWNAPSPAATASLAIGDYISDLAIKTTVA
ncbi:MAG TPA: L-2-hydroxyglutarate oxidase [Saprospiraceae bacterium]|nr:L-2-hydroxyglutarate oxidase [Saprospiraceae bacterium]